MIRRLGAALVGRLNYSRHVIGLWWRVAAALVTLIALYDLAVSQLFPEKWVKDAPRVADAVGEIDWQLWVIVLLAILLLGALEGGYRAAAKVISGDLTLIAAPGLTSEILSVEEVPQYYEPQYQDINRVLGFRCQNLSQSPIKCRIRLVSLKAWFGASKIWYEHDTFSPRALSWSTEYDGPKEVVIDPGADRVCSLVRGRTSGPHRGSFAHIVADNPEDRANKVLTDLYRARIVIEVDGYVPLCQEVFFDWTPGAIALGTQIWNLDFKTAGEVLERIQEPLPAPRTMFDDEEVDDPAP